MRILYITQWFDPEPMIKGVKFVSALRQRGHNVEVITGFPNYPNGRIYPEYRMKFHLYEDLAGIPIHRLALYPSHSTSSLGRITNYLTFALNAVIYGIFRAKQFDVIYVYQPISAALAAALIGSIRRRPIVMDVQDLWPDSVVASGMPGTRRMEGILHRICSFAYSRAARIVAQSRGIAARLGDRGASVSNVEVIYNWADEEAAMATGLCDLDRFDFSDHFTIVYGGNLGRVQGLETLVRAAHKAVREVPQLKLLLIGNGTEETALRALTAEIGAKNVAIEPGVPRTQIGDIFDAADVLAVHLINEPLFEITVPQKIQFYLAMGKPVLCGVKGEAAALVLDAGAGVSFDSGDVDSAAAAMVRLARMPRKDLVLMGVNARKAYWKRFSFAAAIDKTEQVLNAAVATYR